MRAREWFRSVAGLVRVEARAALPMMIVLCLAGAAALVLARWLFDVTPESLLREPTHAWWVLAGAGTIPLCAELFSGGGRSVAARTLRPLPVRTSAVLDAKIVVLALGATLLWAWVGAVDLTLDTQMARTKILPTHGEASVRLLLGSAALALTVTGLVAGAVRNALAATVVGLMVQAVLGTILLSPTWATSHDPASTLVGLVRTATYFAVHPVVLCLAGLAVGWCLALRGPAKSDATRGLALRTLGGGAWAGLATVTALGSSAWATASYDPMDLDDPAASIGQVMPSPDGKRVAINLYRWKRGPRTAEPAGYIAGGWVLDLETGEDRPAMTPQEIAARVPFGAPNSSIRGWDDDGQALRLELSSDVPWIGAEGRLDLEQGWSTVETAPFPRVHSKGEYTMGTALERFLASSAPGMKRTIEDLRLHSLRSPRADATVLFGETHGGLVYRADGRSGSLDLLECIPADLPYFDMDRTGSWVVLPETKTHGAASAVNVLTGERIPVPEEWTPSWRFDSDVVVRPRGLLATKKWPLTHDRSEVEWGWMGEQGVEPALEGSDIDAVFDLDGDRFLGLSRSRGTLELFDGDGRVIKVLRQPRGSRRSGR